MKKRFSEDQTIPILKEAESGVLVKEILRKYAISDATFYTWRKKYGGMEVSEARLKPLEPKSDAVRTMQSSISMSERRACYPVGLLRATIRYQDRPK